MDIFISGEMHNFILLAQTSNTTRAAERTHMTVSSFDESTATLEEQIGYTLLIRKDNNISLNKVEQGLYQKLFPVYQRLFVIDNEAHDSGCRSRETMTSIDNTYPIIILDQLINLRGKYGGVTTQPVGFDENGAADNLFDRQLDFIISPQHVSTQVQELEDLIVSELPPLRLSFLVSRRYEECQEQELLQELPWLQVRFQNRANFETTIDANIRPCGINPTIICRPYSLVVKANAAEREHFLTAIPHFVWRLVNLAVLKYFNAPHRPMCIQEYLCLIRGHRYAATMLQHITEDHDGTNH